jgi:hypothetical protein
MLSVKFSVVPNVFVINFDHFVDIGKMVNLEVIFPS